MSTLFPDDIYRSRLAETIEALERWAVASRDVASVAIAATPAYWKLAVDPSAPGACPFELVLRADQRFNTIIDREVYEDKPIDKFEFFPMMARAISNGSVERIETLNALTGMLDVIEMRLTLEDGWAWIGERRTSPRLSRRLDIREERRVFPYLPYRRKL
jgi:hypothetical protein